MRNLKRFWKAVETLPTHAAVEVEWRTLVGDEHILIKPFLRAQKNLALSYPRRDGGLPFEVIEHAPSDYVGVCRETGETISLSKRDLVVYELASERLAEKVANALGLACAKSLVIHEVEFFSLGNIQLNGSSVAVYLILPNESSEVILITSDLMSQAPSPFLLLTPTGRFRTAELNMRLRAHGSSALNLTDVLIVSDDGSWSMIDGAIHAALPTRPSNIEPARNTPRVVIQFIAGDRGGSDRAQLLIPREEKGIRGAVSAGRFRDTFDFAPPLYAASITDVIACRQHSPNIIHFAGHGTERRMILLRDRDHILEKTTLDCEQAEVFFRNFEIRIRLVVFNTCESLELAKHLTSRGTVDMAVGVEGRISDDHAVLFAKEFYGLMANGENVQRSFDLAKLHLGSGDSTSHPQLLCADKIDPSVVVLGAEV